MVEQHYSIRKASDVSGFHPSSIRRWIKRGVLRAALVGGRYRIPETSLRNLLKPTTTNDRKSVSGNEEAENPWQLGGHR
jgi:excisionase family DNA binding protein